MNKYNAKKVTIDGYTFDSQAEARRYTELKLLQIAGKIEELKVHPRYVLQEEYRLGIEKIKPIVYFADFQYFDHEREKVIVEDVKGVVTRESAMKIKIFRYKYLGFQFEIVR